MITVTRSGLFSFCLILAALNALSQRAIVSIGNIGWDGSLFNLFGISAIFWFALFGLYRIARDAKHHESLSRLDWAIAGGLVFTALLPTHAAAVLGTVSASLWLLLTARRDGPSRRIGIIGLGLSAPLFWGPLILRIIGPELLIIDAWLVSTISGLPQNGNVISGIGEDFRMTIGQGCSSLRNISQVLLLLAVVTQLFGIAFNRVIILSGIAAIIGVIIVNAVRLAAIGYFPVHYESLHNGIGSVWFGWANLIVMLVIIGAGMIYATRLAR